MLFRSATEITRDELKFARFVIRLRTKFTNLFIKMLEKQLVLKGVMTIEDWEKIAADIKFDYAKDNYFTELKENEILMQRIATLQQIFPFVGTYYSQEWVKKNVLQMSDEDIKDIDAQIKSEPQPNPEEGQQ